MKSEFRRGAAVLLTMGSVGLAACDKNVVVAESKPAAAESKPVDRGQLPPNVRVLQVPERQTALDSARRSDLPKPEGDLLIEGRRMWAYPFVSARSLRFASGAELVFTCDAVMARKTIFVIVEELTSADQQHPGRISWDCAQRSAPSELGTAESGGDVAVVEGATGGRGTDGKTGAHGETGRDAPNLTVVALRVTNPVIVAFSGQDGGAGGKGQIGGRGGGGGHGNPASQDAFNCRRGAGNGASGGAGGTGGQGGTGGTGGRGGELTLIVPDDVAPIGTRLLNAQLSGGSGGAGGAGGDAGSGGPGGPGGQEARPWCVGNGGQGATGSSSSAGQSGAIGERGHDGDFFVGSLQPGEFQRLTRSTT